MQGNKIGTKRCQSALLKILVEPHTLPDMVEHCLHLLCRNQKNNLSDGNIYFDSQVYTLCCIVGRGEAVQFLDYQKQREGRRQGTR